MPQFWIYHQATARKLPKSRKVDPKANGMAPSKFLDLPAEVLQLISQYLPYQSTLRLLATCRSLRYLLTQTQLGALRYADPLEVYKIELEIYKKLKRRPDWGHQLARINPYFGIRDIPCYTCLRWLDNRIYFQHYELYSFGSRSSKRRKCIACLVDAGVYRNGHDCSRYWKTCLECGRLAWKGTSEQVKVPPEGALLLYGEKFCVTCAGKDGENLAELLVKWDPQVRRERRRAALWARREEVREARRVERALQGKDDDILAGTVVGRTLSELFVAEY